VVQMFLLKLNRPPAEKLPHQRRLRLKHLVLPDQS
jgi:hypothetical protein